MMIKLMDVRMGNGFFLVRGLLVFFIFLVFFSLLPLVSAQVVTADLNPSKSSGGAVTALYCKGADMSKLADTSFKRCARFMPKVMEYYKKYGLDQLGVDPLQLTTVMFYESGCHTREEMKAWQDKYKGTGKDFYRTWQGGPFQVDDPCWKYYNKGDKCPTLDIQLEEGVKEYKQKFTQVKKYAESKGVSLKPEEITWLIWFSYNRGIATSNLAIRNMAKGMTIQQATDEACQCYYGTKDGKVAPCRPKSGWNKYKPWCTHTGSLGIQYAGRLWEGYKKNCEKLGGSLDSGPVSFAGFQPGASGAGVSGSAGSSGVSLGRPSRPEHPAFSVPFSLDPSFKVSLPYDFSVYENITKVLPRLEHCLADIDCISQNISIIESEMPGFDWMAKEGGNILTKDLDVFPEWYKWERYCEPPDLNALTSLAEAISECLRSPEKDCVCKYDIPIAGEKSKSAGGLLDLLTTFGFSSFSAPKTEWKSRKIALRNSGGNVVLSLKEPSDPDVKPQVVDNAHLIRLDHSLQSLFAQWYGDKDVLWYSSDDSGKSLDIFKQGARNFSIFAGGEAPSQKVCKLNNRIVKFCVVSDKKFTAYDAKKNRFGIMNIAVKFAYLFKSKISDVKNLVISDAKLAQDKVVVSWDEMISSDVTRYTLYVSSNVSLKKWMEDKDPSDVRSEIESLPDTRVLDFEVSSKQSIFDLRWPLVPVCNVSSQTCVPEFPLITKVQGGPSSVQLMDDTLYYVEALKKYFVILPDVKDGVPYTFAITATDTDGQESPVFSFPKSFSYSADDLPPALPSFSAGTGPDGLQLIIDTPTMNLDGSDLNQSDLLWYRAYCFDPDSEVIDLSGAFPTSNTVKYKDGDLSSTLMVSYDECDPHKKGSAYVVVVASDKDRQEFKGLLDPSFVQKVIIPVSRKK